MDSLLLAVMAGMGDFQSVLVKGSRFMKMERVVEALMSQDRANKSSENNKKGEAHAA
jgi:UDP-N-acetylmuramoyl-tripeptide--D-alanyl-D-alanine ligase